MTLAEQEIMDADDGESQNDAAQESSTDQATEEQSAQTETDKGVQEVKDWRSSISDPSLSKFIQNFNTPEDLAKSALQFRQKLSNAISIPGAGASEEEVKAYREKIGVPESMDGYEVSMPEALPETLTKEELEPIIGKMKESLFQSGASKDVASAVIKSTLDMVARSHEEAINNWKKNVETSDAELRKEWGEDYEPNKTYAQRAFKQFGGEDFVELLESAKVGNIELINHPAMTKVFADIGRKMGEGGLQYIATEQDTESFEASQDELTAKAHAAMDRGDRIEAERLFKKRDEKEKSFRGTDSI